MPIRFRSIIGLLRSSTFWLVLTILVLGAMATTWLSSHDPKNFRDAFGWWAIAITLALHVVLAISPFPSDLIAIANGAIYGLMLGAMLSWLGWWISGILEFALGRRARAEFQLDRGLANAPRWLQRFPVEHPVFLIGVRQVPWLGMHVASFVPGAAGVKLSRFLWCSIIGAIPGSLLMTAIGAGLIQLR